MQVTVHVYCFSLPFSLQVGDLLLCASFSHALNAGAHEDAQSSHLPVRAACKCRPRRRTRIVL